MKNGKKEQKSNYRIERTSHRERFEIITNYHLTDKRLTLSDKGFLTMLYTLPNGWKITQRATATYFNIDKNTFNRYIKKLAEIGYIEAKKTAKNRITYIIKEQSDKAPFDIENIANYTPQQLNKFLNDTRIEERYKALIKKMLNSALETAEHFNETLNEIEQETENEKTTAEPLPFE